MKTTATGPFLFSGPCAIGSPGRSNKRPRTGAGPQFTKSFAKRQSRLLGGSVLVCKNKKILLKRLSLLLKGKVDRLEQAKIGKKRMGESGASKKIVDAINLHLLS